ncbi:hypothetical protein [Treponema sp.]|uniref:hypothetical protein n=1 Tax=Treponema sp. TaxID=166 RepID=UPI0025FA5AE6|nr:hypothetical protein [Treponema sp.]MCR5217428.1 hypothetical protein [Treponema sp.]
MKNFSGMNKLSKKGQTVFFGSTSLSQMDLGDLMGNSCSTHIYNRSKDGLTIDRAQKEMEECACQLQPSRLFINIGEEDIEKEDFTIDGFISKYEWLLYQLHTRCDTCTLYIISVMSDSPKTAKVNRELSRLAKDTGCVFINVAHNTPWSFLASVKPFIRSFPISFAEAMQYAG